MKRKSLSEIIRLKYKPQKDQKYLIMIQHNPSALRFCVKRIKLSFTQNTKTENRQSEFQISMITDDYCLISRFLNCLITSNNSFAFFYVDYKHKPFLNVSYHDKS